MLWIPGPTEVRPEVLAELARPMIGHRGPEMGELLERIDPGLRLAFGLADGSSSAVAVGTHSATGLMEGALHGVGERVLSVVGGAFAKRWHEIARLLGKDARALAVEPGRVVDPGALADVLRREGPFDALTVVVNETSTGVRTPLERLDEALADFPDVLVLADVVSLVGGAAIDFDAHRLDLALAGVNKALALPPGITVFCVSERYVELARARERRSWYLDPLRTLDGHRARKTPATPSIPHYRALARQLEDVTSGATLPERERSLAGAAAWRARFAKHERMRDRTLAWARGHGLAPFPEEAGLSPTVSCVRAGDVHVPTLLAGLAERGHRISNGYGDLKDRTFRIGHLGDHTEEHLEALLRAADDVLT